MANSTKDKYQEMGFDVKGRAVTDRFSQRYYPKKARTPLKAIRLFCLECMGWDRTKSKSDKPFEDVKNCTDPMCPLFDFRFGKNPFLKGGPGNIEALKKAREHRKEST